MKRELQDQENTNGFPKQSTWEWIKQYVNCETEVVRTDLVYFASITDHNLTTLENYRAELSYAGYLTKADGTGRYKVLKAIPEHFTTTELRKEHYEQKQVRWNNYVKRLADTNAEAVRKKEAIERENWRKWIPCYGLMTRSADRIMKTRTNAKAIYFLYQLGCYIALMFSLMALVSNIMFPGQ